MTTIYGHRGAKGEMPENTLPSVQQCLAHGVTRCELDIRLSQDGVPMVFHDANLKRTTGVIGKFKQFTSQQLIALPADFHCATRHPQATIPSLELLFQHCQFEHWQLEIKAVPKATAIATVLAVKQLVERYQLSQQITLTSASFVVLKAAQQYAPELARGYVAEWRWYDPLKIAQRYQCQLLALSWKLCTPHLAARAKALGLPISVWTVNEPKRMLKLVEMGVDSLITDFPGLASATLGNR